MTSRGNWVPHPFPYGHIISSLSKMSRGNWVPHHVPSDHIIRTLSKMSWGQPDLSGVNDITEKSFKYIFFLFNLTVKCVIANQNFVMATQKKFVPVCVL